MALLAGVIHSFCATQVNHMNQTIASLCQAQQWSTLFETLSDLRFLETHSTKEELPLVLGALRHALYLAEIPLLKNGRGEELMAEQNAAESCGKEPPQRPTGALATNQTSWSSAMLARQSTPPHRLLPKDQEWQHPCGAALGVGYLLQLADSLWRYHIDRSYSLFTCLYQDMLHRYEPLAKHWMSQHKEPWLRRMLSLPPEVAPRWRVSGLSQVFSPDNKHILLKHNKKLSLYDLNSREQKSFSSASYQSGGVFVQDGRFVITWENKTAQLWDVASLSPVATFGPHRTDLFLVEVSPDGVLVALCSPKEISIQKISSGEQLLSVTKPPIESDVQHVTFLSDELLLIRNTGFRHYIWNWRSNEILWSHKTKHYLLGIPSVNAKRDKLLLVDGEFVCCYAMPSGKELFSVKLSGGAHNSIQFHPTEDKAIVAAWSPGAYVIDGNTGDISQIIHGSNTWKAGFIAPDRYWLHSQRGVHLSAKDGNAVASFSSPSTGGSDEYPVFSPDGRYLLIQHARTQTTALYELSQLSVPQTAPGLSSLNYGTRVTPEGDQILVWQDRSFSLFSLQEERCLKTIEGRPQMYIDKNRKLLTNKEGGGFDVFDTQTGAQLFSIPGAPEDAEPRSSSPNRAEIVNEDILLTSDGKHTRRWDLNTGAMLYEVEGEIPHYRTYGSRGVYFFVIGGEEKKRYRSVFRVSDGGEVRRFEKDTWSALSSDGRWLVERPWYDDALVYDVATGELRYTFKDVGTIDDARFSEDNQSLYTWRTEQAHITSDPESVVSEWSLVTGEKTSSDKDFPVGSIAPFIEGWSRTTRQLRGPKGEQIYLPHEMRLYHQYRGRHYMAGVSWGLFYVYEVMV
jgi:hypothetical protein